MASRSGREYQPTRPGNNSRLSWAGHTQWQSLGKMSACVCPQCCSGCVHGLTRTDVGENSDLRRQQHRGTQEGTEELREWSLERPLVVRVEYHFTAPVGVPK